VRAAIDLIAQVWRRQTQADLSLLTITLSKVHASCGLAWPPPTSQFFWS